MKYYNKILEAVNKGIQLALDDYEDNEPISSLSQQNDVIDSEDVIKQKYNLMKESIDLGLPSGTLWCKYNLGVDPNQLANAKDWYGNYYAWGELKSNKSKYNWNNYKFGKDTYQLTKYCDNPKYGLNGFTDNLTQLLPEDDVTYQNKKLYNFKFHIPTKEQCEELLKYTNNYCVKNYDPNKTIHNQEDDGGIQGLNGRIFEGKNKNQLFIPAAGYYEGSNNKFIGSNGFLWSSSFKLDTPYEAYYLWFNLFNITIYHDYRYKGFPIHPVINL